ncbi:MAG: ACP S-malonyltransferase [Verrucomicrobia bacterium]|jgi:malonyl CoA-acyl carrier protein transacylase|nr:ACP S-malonyltransferase [Verrucomicrobiota bacterium]MDA7510861.1 ACP S-malonyltransferase [Verrucomicrobiota bacterium]
MSTICLFPGQGAQKQGMGEALFDRFPEEVALVDGILGYSIRELCLENPEGRLAKTQYTQPALFTVSALGFMARQADGGSAVDYLAGHSLGEYTALFAAGGFDFATGIRLVQKRGQLMSEVVGGGMAAILGLTSEAIQKALVDGGFSDIDLANQNSLKQTVIAGPKQEVEACAPVLAAAGGKVIPLAVSGAFHSRQMRPVAEHYRDYLKGISFGVLKTPVIANVTAKPYVQEEIVDILARQIASPVLWADSVGYLLGQPEPEFEEIGPGKVLSGLIRQIKAGR